MYLEFPLDDLVLHALLFTFVIRRYFTMINNTEFADRLKVVMSYHQLSASSFADKIQVPRSSISHLLSGRNKPSLDFVLKVVKQFDEVDLYWLLNGKGSFPKGTPASTVLTKEISEPMIDREIKTDQKQSILNTPVKKIERIVIFYEDGTFKEYIQ